jgi:hypothetical protein
VRARAVTAQLELAIAVYASQPLSPAVTQHSLPSHSFDHLVGARGEPGMHVKPERPGGLEVDHEFEPGGLINRQVGGLFALENPSDGRPARRYASVVSLP